MSKIYDIDKIPQELLPTVGGKARGLNQLKKFGFRIPEAFIVTHTDDDSDSYDEAVRHYNDLGMGLVSVRSSATLEDGQDFSAAGQFSTYLNIQGDDQLRQAIKDCVASLHNATAEKYASTFLRSAECKMTVVVQRMVEARSAGVIFSRAPMRPGYVLVEAVPGLGENLVSGKMSAQQYRVRDGKVEHMPEHSILSQQEAVNLGTAGKKAEEFFGMPMDLEWAIDKDGKIMWLQARPITISESVTMNELDCTLDATESVFTTGNIGEVIPGAVTPLTLSTNMYALDWGVKKTYQEMGCAPKNTPAWSFLASYYNHMFFNMTSIYRVNHATYGTTKETSDVSICGKVLEGLPGNRMKDLSTFSRIRNTISFANIVFKGNYAKEGMDDVVSKLHFDLKADKHNLYKQTNDNLKYLMLAQYFHYRASYYSGGQSAMLNKCEKDFDNPDEFKALVAGCMTQNENFESANILRSMYALAQKMVSDQPKVTKYTTEELSDYLDNKSSLEVRNEYKAFMLRHGFRGLREPELMSLPWRDNRESFLTSIKSVLLSVGNQHGHAERAWTSYAEELLSRYSGIRRRYVKSLIDKARRGVCYREYTKAKVIYVLDQFKQAYLQLARLMVEDQTLPDVECIYFLQQKEIGDLLKGDLSLVKKAMARRRLFPQQQKLKFKYAQLGIPEPLTEPKPDGKTAAFQGTPVSRGIATGRARVVRNEKDASELKEGEIMVANCTDIGWSPYYSIIAGLVTEIGSALSHGVVVAREYALPTVVNASNAMTLIHTGDNITIDGNSGRVTINKKA